MLRHVLGGGSIKLTGLRASPIIRRSFELTIKGFEWKGDKGYYVFHISTTVQLEKETRARV
jgi:hypothetical protein